mmetsp:Transcript_2379/g.7247  ORF Transcript_2379/g.7247 Transcript_2379/m.7247 type:complete len:200 (-) Transcript_2379:2222-2821(-)
MIEFPRSRERSSLRASRPDSAAEASGVSISRSDCSRFLFSNVELKSITAASRLSCDAVICVLALRSRVRTFASSDFRERYTCLAAESSASLARLFASMGRKRCFASVYFTTLRTQLAIDGSAFDARTRSSGLNAEESTILHTRECTAVEILLRSNIMILSRKSCCNKSLASTQVGASSPRGSRGSSAAYGAGSLVYLNR